MIYEYTLKTEKENFYNVTKMVQEAVSKSGIKDGICVVFNPHTTAGMTINENCDPDVVTDLLFALNKTYPDRPEFRHSEGNSAAHLKASVIGSSVKYSLQGTTQGNGLTGGLPPVRFSM